MNHYFFVVLIISPISKHFTELRKDSNEHGVNTNLELQCQKYSETGH